MSGASKVSVYSVSELKNTTDDILPNYLTSLKFEQNHKSTDVRLGLGFSAVSIAAALFYYDWKFGWDYSKPYTLPAVVVYFILNGIFTYWIWFVEDNTVFHGDRNGTKIIIQTKSEKYTPVYNMVVRWTKAKEPYKLGAEWKEIKTSAPFTRWFTSDGMFVAKPFQQWLASEIPAIGEADPNNVVEEIGRGNATEGVAATTGPKVMNVDINNLGDVLGAIQGQAQSGAKQRRKG